MGQVKERREVESSNMGKEESQGMYMHQSSLYLLSTLSVLLLAHSMSTRFGGERVFVQVQSKNRTEANCTRLSTFNCNVLLIFYFYYQRKKLFKISM